MSGICLSAYGLVFLYCIFSSEGTFGGSDSWTHYLFAHYAFAHPSNYLDQWAKPVFTFLASPFAYFGFTAIRLFNTLCALITAWISYRIAKRQDPLLAWVSILFTFGIPYFFMSAFSGLTEILFALFVMLGIHLYQLKKTFLSFLVISFLPFVRSEGMLIIPVFGVMALVDRKFLLIPVLLIGSIFFSLIGLLRAGDWKWIFTTNPYARVSGSPYGSGSIFHFVQANEFIAGIPQVLLFIAALIIFIINIRRLEFDFNFRLMLILVTGCFFMYFTGHSIFWKLGIFGSAGLTRVMAGIGPCIALIAFYAFRHISALKVFQRNWFRIIAVIFIAWIVIIPRQQHKIPVKYNELEALDVKAAEWIKAQNLRPGYLAYSDPFITIPLGTDPFDKNRAGSLTNGISSLKTDTGSLLVWDSHFGPAECGIPFAWLESNPSLSLLHAEYISNSMMQRGDTLQVRVYQVLSSLNQ
jgi:hypothetical protein